MVYFYKQYTGPAFLPSPPVPTPFTVCLTRQLHFTGAERQALSCRVRTDGPVTLLSYKQASIKKIYTHVSVWIHKPFIFKGGDVHVGPARFFMREETDVRRSEKKKHVYGFWIPMCLF